MDIMSGRKKWMLLSVLVIIGASAFVYFDPLDLNLLGQKVAPAVAMPKVPPRVTAPAAKPGTAVPSVQPPAAASKVSAAPAQASVPAAPPKAPQQPVKPVTPTPAATPVVASSVATPVQAAEPSSKSAETIRPENRASQPSQTASKSASRKSKIPKDADLRHCLDLESNAAIAKCAGE
jgi:hypothetical protein